jgi:competence protein ComEC
VLALLLCGCAKSKAPGSAPASDNLTVHFIDVGQADCALLECDGKFMLIDGGNVADSSLVVSYLQKAGVEELEAVVCSHAHEDHVGGLPGVLAVFPTKAVYAPTRTYSSKCFDDFLYYTDQQGLTVTIPKVGDAIKLGGTTATVLGPVKTYADPNNTSIVLMVQFGENKFLFTGDMETEAENDMLDAGAKVKADVLKVGHHGSNTSTGYRLLYEVDPTYAIISVGKGNTYGHPHDEPMSRLRDAEVMIFRTDELGSIVAVSDGKNITFTWDKSAAQPEDPTESSQYYIGNKNSKILHLPTCNSLPAEKNQVRFDSYEDAIAQGYTPCGRCME